MNLPVVWRVIWKEYRLQRSLWLVVVALAVLVDLLTLWCDPHPFYTMITFHFIALITPALYALGCGATLFAGEHEAETYEFQRSLPVRASSLLLGKVAFAVASTAAMLGLMMLLAHLLAPLPSPPPGYPAPWRVLAWTTVGFFEIEVFVWAAFFSLLSRRVLIAAVLGVTAASIGAHVAAATITWNVVMESYMQAMPWRIAIAAAVALADVWLAARWFREKRGKRSRAADTSAIAPQQAAALGDRFLRPQRLAILGRLVWQHWRQSRRMSLVITLLLFPLVAIATALLMQLHGYPAWFIEVHNGEIYLPMDKLFFSMQVTLALATVPMFGVGAFLADQRRNSFRFLTDRGVPPRFVWLSRELVTLGIPMSVFISLLLGLFFLASVLLPAPTHSDSVRWVNLSTLYAGAYYVCYLFLGVLGYVFLGITVGQLCSMFLRSPLLAGLFSVLLTIVLLNWCGLMLFWQVNWVWSILPIPLVLLLATRLRTAGWLLERNGPRAWLRPGLALLIPAAALLIAVPLYRVYSIPLVDPGFSADEFSQPLTPEEQATLGLYEQALPILTPLYRNGTEFGEHPRANELTPDETAWVGLNSERIAIAEKASRRKIHNCPTGPSLPAKEALSQLARLLVCSAVVREEKGELDVALHQYLAAVQLASYLRNWYPVPLAWNERFNRLERGGEMIETNVYARLPRWATRKGQTPERIIAAVRRLEEMTSEAPASNQVKLAYLRLRRFLSGDFKAICDPSEPQPLPTLTALWFHLPWERARAERLLNRLTRLQLDTLSRTEEGIRRGEPFRPPACGPNVIGYLLCHETEPPYALHAEISIPPVECNLRWGTVKLVQDYVALVVARRATRVVLALEAWKLKHRSLPKKLDELVGHGLDRLPADPYSGKPFHYFHDGLKIPLEWSQPQVVMMDTPSPLFGTGGTIAANVPFLWASGVKLRYVVDRYANVKGNVLGEYVVFARVGNSMDEWRYPDSEFDVWESGWPFPIP